MYKTKTVYLHVIFYLEFGFVISLVFALQVNLIVDLVRDVRSGVGLFPSHRLDCVAFDLVFP